MYIELTEVTAHLERILGVIEEAEYSLFATDGIELEEHKVKSRYPFSVTISSTNHAFNLPSPAFCSLIVSRFPASKY